MNRRTFLAGCSGLFGSAVAGFPADSDAVPKARIDRLIEQLGSKKFNEREAAARALEKMGEKALPALRKAAMEHADSEVRRRAASLVVALERRLGVVPGLIQSC